MFFTADAQQTADFIYTLAKHSSFTRPKGPLIQKRRKVKASEKMQPLLVSSLPGIGPKLADRALKLFGTAHRVFSASVAELSLVDGIGRRKAEKVAKILDAHYRPVVKSPQQLYLDKT